jgi:DNA phosphorothioation-dependent restriction protein DptG
MKKLFSVLLVITALLAIKSVHAQDKPKWKELDEFHEVMSQTFHPAEEGKLEPIRARSAEMVEKATAWENSSAPEGYNKNAVKKSLKKLVQGAKEINRLVKENATDSAIKEKLSALHDVFHEIVEKCQKEEQM